jgi:hypothetical protein
MLFILFGIKGIAHKEFILAVLHTTVMFYSDCLKMCEDFTPNFGGKRTGCCVTTITVSHFLFRQGIFDEKEHDCRPPPTLLA